MNSILAIQSISQTMMNRTKEIHIFSGRLFLVLLLLACSSLFGLAQQYVTLDQPVSGTLEVTASEMVSMIGGFSTAPGMTFSAYIQAQAPGPAAPTGLSYTGITNSSADLSWIDNSLDETHFIIERSHTPGSGFIPIYTAGANSTSYTDAGLESSTNYYFRIKAENATGYSIYSNVLEVATPASANDLIIRGDLSGDGDSYMYTVEVNPNALSIRTILETNDNIITIGKYGSPPTFDDNNWESYYDGGNDIELSNPESGTWYIMVYSLQGSGEYELSCTVDYGPVPSAPTNLSYTGITNSSADISWIDNADDETQFIIERSITSGSGFVPIRSLGENSTSYTDIGLQSSTNYYYRVRVGNAIGYSSYSNVLEVATPVSENDLVFRGDLSGAGDSHMYTVDVNPNALSMYVIMTSGSSDYIIYGKLGSAPTVDDNDWEGNIDGDDNKLVDYPGSGTWYIMVYSYDGSGPYDLTCTVNYPVELPYNIPGVITEVNVSGTPDEDYNYIKTTSYRDEIADEHLENIQYFDGLGRPLQTVNVMASPMGHDIVQAFDYDDFGRQSIRYLPFTADGQGDFQTEALADAVDYYKSDKAPIGKDADNNAYLNIGYENSPLGRVLSEIGAGEKWKDSGANIGYTYTSNASPVPYWNANGGTVPGFAAHTLYLTEITDEQGNTTREYKDKQGKVVQKEAFDNGVSHRTVYIYDDFGRLSIVVPPEATGPEEEEYCYFYKYDERNRMIEKNLPGAEPVYLYYDKRDRLVLSQDGKTRAENAELYNFTKYDALNRPVMTGKVQIPLAQNIRAMLESESGDLYEEFDDQTSGYGYTYNRCYPTVSESDLLTLTYYDNYDFIAKNGLSATLDYNSIPPSSLADYASDKSDYTKGSVTGSMTQLLLGNWQDAINDDKLFSVVYYDDYGNVTQTISENHLGGRDVTFTSYKAISFEVNKTEQQHIGYKSVTLKQEYEYDHVGRLLETRQQLNNLAWKTISALRYNELGEMVEKYLHSNGSSGRRNYLQKVDYRYNVRGWLTAINDPGLGDTENDLFGMKLYYNNTEDFNDDADEACFNGNIGAMEWRVKSEANRGYGFEYDGLNRLKAANYSDGDALNEHVGYYSMAVGSYDKNGNIKRLTRNYNNQLVDDLTYVYSFSNRSNQLERVDESNYAVNNTEVNDYLDQAGDGDYAYDANGNMVADPGKDINDIDYNYLNLPQTISHNNASIHYLYDANGTKRAKAVYTSPGGSEQSNTQYVGNIVYENNEIAYILSGEGRIVPDDALWRYEYYLTDHLGNNRVTFKEATSGLAEIVQSSSYYPFGLAFAEYNASLSYSSNNKYLYNGKELQSDMLGSESLNWYDYGARMYDPSLGRFHCLDPMASEPHNISLTPYHYTNNNPILYIDINGEDWFLNNQTGQMIFQAGVSELDADYLSNIGVDVNIDNFENIGSDEMFDTDELKIADTGYEFSMMSDEMTEEFMGSRGYEKLMERTSTELEFITEDYEIGGKIETTSYLQKVNDKIVYKKDSKFSSDPYSVDVREVDPTNYGSYPESLSAERGFMYKAYTRTSREIMPYDASTFNKTTPGNRRSSTNAGQNVGTTTGVEILKKILKQVLK